MSLNKKVATTSPETPPSKQASKLSSLETARAHDIAIVQAQIASDSAGFLENINDLLRHGQGIPFVLGAKMTVTVWNTASLQIVAFQCWYLDADTGDLKQIPSSSQNDPEALPQMAPSSDGIANYRVVNLPSSGGVIVAFLARVAQSKTPTARGQTLVKAEVDNLGTFIGTNSTASSTQIVVYNYIDSQQDVSYPSPNSVLVVPSTPTGAQFQSSAIMTITVWNTVNNQSLTFQCWYVDPFGILKQITIKDMTSIAKDRSAVLQTMTLPSTGGTIVSFTARCNAGLTYRAQTLVKCEIDNNLSGLSTKSTTLVLVDNYAYTRHDVVYPSDEAIVNPTEGSGYKYFPALSNPAAGHEISISPPSGAVWKFISAQFQLATSSASGNRYPSLELTSAVTSLWNTPVYPAIAPSTTQSPMLVLEYPSPIDTAWDTNGFARAHFPPFEAFNASFTLATSTQNLNGAPPTQINDTYRIIQVFIEEWLQPAS